MEIRRWRTRVPVAIAVIAGVLLWRGFSDSSGGDAVSSVEGRAAAREESPPPDVAPESGGATVLDVVPEEPPPLPGTTLLRVTLLRTRTPVTVGEVRAGARVLAAFDPGRIEPRVVLPAGQTLTLLTPDARAGTDEVTFVVPDPLPAVLDLELPAADDRRLDPLLVTAADVRSQRLVVGPVLDLGQGSRPPKVLRVEGDGWIHVDRAAQAALLESPGSVSAPGFYPRAWRGAVPRGLPVEAWRRWDRTGALAFPLRPADPDDVTSPLVTVRLVRDGRPDQPVEGLVVVRSTMDPDYRETHGTDGGLARFAPPPVFAVDVYAGAALVGTFAFVRDSRGPDVVREVPVPTIERHEVRIDTEGNSPASREVRRARYRAGQRDAPRYGARFHVADVTPLDALDAFAAAEARHGVRAGLLALEPGSVPLVAPTDPRDRLAFHAAAGARWRVVLRREGDPKARRLDGASLPGTGRVDWDDLPTE